MSHCRWVIIAEESFDQLRQLKPTQEVGTDPGSPVGEPPVIEAPPPDEEPVKEPVEEPHVEEPPVEEQREPTLEELDWTSDLPPSYRKEGAQLLQRLQEAGLQVSDTGVVSVSGQSMPDYHIGTLLRTTSVPFHRGQIPLQLQEWLRTKGMVKFRNHLATIRPQWRKRYSLRTSTTATQ